MFSEKAQKEIGSRFREIRISVNKTQLEFSEAIHISSNFLSEIENGKKGASYETIYNICEEYHVSADYILFGKKKQNKPAESIAETANNMSIQEIDVAIGYLQALKNMKEIDASREVEDK